VRAVLVLATQRAAAQVACRDQARVIAAVVAAAKATVRARAEAREAVQASLIAAATTPVDVAAVAEAFVVADRAAMQVVMLLCRASSCAVCSPLSMLVAAMRVETLLRTHSDQSHVNNQRTPLTYVETSASRC
jgi:hypothetical protein